MTNKLFTCKGRQKENKKNSIISIIRNDSEVQEVLKEEAHRVEKEEQLKAARDTDIFLLMALHRIYGFGAVRLTRFIEGLAELRGYYEDRYEDDYIYAMEQQLVKETGLDIDYIEREVMNYAEKKDSD